MLRSSALTERLWEMMSFLARTALTDLHRDIQTVSSVCVCVCVCVYVRVSVCVMGGGGAALTLNLHSLFITRRFVRAT